MKTRIESPDSHELYSRRGARNKATLITLLLLVGMIFAVTMVKLDDGGEIVGFDHTFETAPPVDE